MQDPNTNADPAAAEAAEAADPAEAGMSWAKAQDMAKAAFSALRGGAGVAVEMAGVVLTLAELVGRVRMGQAAAHRPWRKGRYAKAARRFGSGFCQGGTIL